MEQSVRSEEFIVCASRINNFQLLTPHSSLLTWRFKAFLLRQTKLFSPEPGPGHTMERAGGIGMELWAADGEKGLMRVRDGQCVCVGPPGASLCAAGRQVFCAGKDCCRCYDRETCALRFETALPPGVCALAEMEGRLFALSAEADSMTAFSAETGEILCCAPAGMYPRDMCLHPRFGWVLAAGGAAGEMLLLNRELRLLRAYRLPGAVCGACFSLGGMAALCAVERGAGLEARLCSVSLRGTVEEALALPMTPCCLCPLPRGGCAVGCCGGVTLFRANKKAALRQPFSCPVRLRADGGRFWICDIGEGSVRLSSGKALYRGGSPQDALLFP